MYCVNLYCVTVRDSLLVLKRNTEQIKSLSLTPSGYRSSNTQKYWTADIIIKKKIAEIV